MRASWVVLLLGSCRSNGMPMNVLAEVLCRLGALKSVDRSVGTEVPLLPELCLGSRAIAPVSKLPSR
jgi:hypothetical protein